MVKGNYKVFLELVGAGLWETEVELAEFGEIDFREVYRIAEEQAVVGLVAAALDYVSDVKIPRENAMTFGRAALQLEQRNLAMNKFIAKMFEQLKVLGMKPILVKGQGIAQCYERPLWRASGDIDLFLNGIDYDKAKEWFESKGHIVLDEHEYRKRIEYAVDSWCVELHGTLRGDLSGRIDKVIDLAQTDVFSGGKTREWMDGETKVLLPSADADIIFVFTHILQHFFMGGIGLRQICDWCRLLWCFGAELDLQLLESRINSMGLMSEWRAFAALAVDGLGMPSDAMPFYSSSKSWKRKSKRILRYIFKVGNFGHNRDTSYKQHSPFLKRMIISFHYRTSDFLNQVTIFPIDAIRAYLKLCRKGFDSLIKRAM